MIILAENGNNSEDTIPPCPTPDGTLSEHSIDDPAEETCDSDSENVQVVKSKTANKKKKRKKEQAKTAVVVDSRQPSPCWEVIVNEWDWTYPSLPNNETVGK